MNEASARAHARMHVHAARAQRTRLHVRNIRPVSPVKGEARYCLALKEVVRAACAGKAAERLQHVHLQLLRQWLALLHDETPVSVRATAVDRLPNDGVREAVDLAKVLQVLRQKKSGILAERMCASAPAVGCGPSGGLRGSSRRLRLQRWRPLNTMASQATRSIDRKRVRALRNQRGNIFWHHPRRPSAHHG